MNVGAAKTALTRYGFDTTDPLNAWLDQAKIEVEESFDWPFLQSIATIAQPAGSSAVSLSGQTDFFKVQSLRDVTTKRKISYRDIDGFERDVQDPTQTGRPTIFTVTALNVIQLYPVPDTALSLRLVYQTALADINGLADGTACPGPSRLHYLYVLGAAYIGLQAENEEERSGTAQAMFEKGVARLMRKYSSYLGEAQTVIDAQGYGNS